MIIFSSNSYNLKHLSLFIDTCLPSLFTCVPSGQCIVSNKTCNGIVDCDDGSDEMLVAGCCKYFESYCKLYW